MTLKQQVEPELPEQKSGGQMAATGVSGSGTQSVQAKAGQAQSKDATATDASTVYGSVTPEATVQHQVGKIVDKGGPMMERAKQMGMFSAGRRGLSNSSIAVGAAQGAMVDRALPIASQDAAHHQQQNLTNQGEANATERFNAQNRTSVDVGNADRQTQTSQFNAQMNTQNSQFNASSENRFREMEAGFNYDSLSREQQQEYDMAMQELKGQQSVDLMNIEANYKQVLQTNASAAQMMQSYMDSISQVLSTKGLSKTHVSNALDTFKKSLTSGLDVLSTISGMDLSKYQTGGTTGGGSYYQDPTSPSYPGGGGGGGTSPSSPRTLEMIS